MSCNASSSSAGQGGSQPPGLRNRGCPTALAFSPAFGRDQILFAAGPTTGVFRSDDGGQIWRESGFPSRAGVGEEMALAFSLHCPQDDILSVASPAGVSRSQEGGTTWEKLTQGLVSPFPDAALALPPDFARRRTLFLGGGFRQPQIFLSHSNLALALSPDFGRDQRLIAAAADQGLQRRDGGAHWATIGTAQK